MALKSTIFKAELQIADMFRGYYQDHRLTIVRHPSENDERMMVVRVLAFALHADEALVLGDSIGNEDEPYLWQKDLTGSIQIWIDVGQPDEKRIRRACGRAEHVFIYTYGGHGIDAWWDRVRKNIERFGNLTVIALPAFALSGLQVWRSAA